MRDFKGMKRQRGRNRGGGNQGKPQQNANRAFESNGPDNVKIRGNAQHVFERYQQLARDAGSSGDRVLAENYLQHAEHYFRTIRALQPTRTTAEIIGRETYTSGFDIDFEDESGAQAEQPEAEVQDGGGEEGRQDRFENRQRDDRPRDDRPRDDRPRDDRARDDRPRDDRQRDDRPRDDRQRDDRPRDRQRDDRQRDDRPRDDRPRDDRPRDERPRDREFNRDDRPRDRDRDRPFNREDRPRDRERDRDRDRPFREERPVEPVASAPEPAPSFEAPPQPAENAHMLRSEDGGESHAPAFLQVRASTPRTPAAETAGEEAPKPKRRRAPRADAPASTEEA
jgi:hypothetical protein